MKRREFLYVLPAGLLACRTWSPPVAPGDWSEVRRRTAAFVERDRAPGIAVAVTRGGEEVFSATAGLASIEPPEPVTAGTRFRIASVTKSFIGPLFLRLERSGALRLEDAASAWLPDFPRAGAFTLRMLLNHTSGLGDYTRQPMEVLARDGVREYAAEDMVRYLAGISPLFAAAPGTEWRYSNSGYVLLGIVAERATGIPIASLVRRELTAPAGLGETAWDTDLAEAPRRAAGYGYRSGGWVPAPEITTSYVGGSGGIRSSARDLCRWFHALLNTASVLTEAEKAELLAPARLADGRQTTNGQGASYGMGVWTGSANGTRVVWHSGTTAGYSADARCYPDRELVIAMIANADASRMGSAPRALRQAILQALGA